jgi:hypothetical protein
VPCSLLEVDRLATVKTEISLVFMKYLVLSTVSEFNSVSGGVRDMHHAWGGDKLIQNVSRNPVREETAWETRT